VDDQEGPSRFSERDAKDISRANVKAVDAPNRRTSCGPKSIAPVEGQDPELLLASLGGPRDDSPVVRQSRRGFERGRSNRPTTQLDGG